MNGVKKDIRIKKIYKKLKKSTVKVKKKLKTISFMIG